MKIAIIGAGMAGLACADTLVAAGCQVVLFDKGRGPGGRMSTRRVTTTAGEAAFDHGAPFFTAIDPRFSRMVAGWEAHGVVASWPAAGEGAFVGVPAMNAVVKAMAAQHEVHFNFQVKALHREANHWRVAGEAGAHGPFAAVVIAVPPEQAATMLSLHDFALARSALLARSQPCWTAMIGFAGPVPSQEHVLQDRGPMAWAVRNNAKPGRGSVESWVIHASATWSNDHLETEAPAVQALLVEAFAQAVATPLPEIVYGSAHRWRFALSSGNALGSLWNEALRIGACGDWLIEPTVEGAWLSGQQLGAKIAGAVPTNEALVTTA